MAAKKATSSETAAARKAKVASVKKKTAAARKRAGGATKNQLGGFVEFIRTQGVIGLAVGLAIGTAAGDTVKKLVEGFITPLVQLIVGSQDGLEKAVFQVEIGGRSADFGWGAFVSSSITLIATAFVIYLIIHFAKLDRLDKKKDA